MDGVPGFRTLQQPTTGAASSAELSGMVQRLQLQAGGHYELLPSPANLNMQTPLPALVNNIGALGGFSGSGEPAAGSWLSDQDLSPLLTSLSRGGQVNGSHQTTHPNGIWPYASNGVFNGALDVPHHHRSAHARGSLPGVGAQPTLSNPLQLNDASMGNASTVPHMRMLMNRQLATADMMAGLSNPGLDLLTSTSVSAGVDLRQAELHALQQQLIDLRMQELAEAQAAQGWGSPAGLPPGHGGAWSPHLADAFQHRQGPQAYDIPGVPPARMPSSAFQGPPAQGQLTPRDRQHPAALNNHELLLLMQQQHGLGKMFPPQGIGYPTSGGRRMVQGGGGGRAAPGPRSKTQGQQQKAPPGPRKPENSSKVPTTPPPEQIRERTYVPGMRPRASMEELDRLLLEKVEDLVIKDDKLRSYQSTFTIVKNILNSKWENAKIHLFGSAANGTALVTGNHIDVCIEIPDLPEEQAEKAQVVCDMEALFLKEGIEVLKLPKARVPVAKLTMPETMTKVDVTVNSILWIINTKMVEDYMKIDDRLRQLVVIVKHWAKQRQVNDCFRGTLSSYCYVLMCIHFLQRREPPILPCLHTVGEKEDYFSRTVGRWECEYMHAVDRLKGYGDANKESLADLVWAFFEHWAWKHDYNNLVVSVRTGTYLAKSSKEWTRRVGADRHLICIEDPFETSHDLGRNVDRQTSGYLHKEFERAACVLRDSLQPLPELFQAFKSGKNEA